MAPRHRSTHNHTIARAAGNALIAGGPEAVTFAEVAERCGLAPPTLVQRFHSRSGLLQATALDISQRVAEHFEGAASTSAPALDRLAATLSALAPVQTAAARLSAFADMSAYTRELQKHISYRLAMAVEAGELPRCDIAQLARTLQIAFAGAVTIAGMEGRDVAGEVSTALHEQLSIFV